jgi:hypothetical protein
MTSVTVKSGFWGSGYTLIKDRAPIERCAARVINRRGLKKEQELLQTLIGTTAGSAALSQYARKTAATGQQGGAQTIETVDIVNRNSTAADVTQLKATLAAFPITATKVVNGDGNPRANSAG